MESAARVTGWWIFAGIMLGIAGVLNVVWGIAAIADSKYFTANATYIVSSLHTWGWITLVIGAIQVFAAFSLFGGGGFGRVIGIFSATLAAMIALANTGATPFFSLGVFALCVVVIYQLVKAPEDESSWAT